MPQRKEYPPSGKMVDPVVTAFSSRNTAACAGCLLAWLGASLIGLFVQWGLPSVNSIVAAVVLYVVLARLIPVGIGKRAVAASAV